MVKKKNEEKNLQQLLLCKDEVMLIWDMLVFLTHGISADYMCFWAQACPIQMLFDLVIHPKEKGWVNWNTS